MPMRTLLLDRDGVINEDSPDFIRSADQWKPLPGSLEAIVRAQRAGFRVIVVSNQSGIARGLLDIAALTAIHARIVDELEKIGGRVDAFFYCPHGPQDDCSCRKPRPGLLLAIQERLGIDLARTAFVGDRLTDLQAACNAGARPFLVRTGIAPVSTREIDEIDGVQVFDRLADAVDFLIDER